MRIALQRVVLQAVVADDDVHLRMGLQQASRRRHAIAANEHRHLAAQLQQQGLVANFNGRRGGVALLHRVSVPTVATRNNAGAKAVPLQQRHHRHHRGRFASAADDEIAHHDHRHGQTLNAQKAKFK